MRKFALVLAAAVAATVAAAPASAVTVTLASGVSTQADNSTVKENFNLIADGTTIDTNTKVMSGSSSEGARPAVASGNYASILGGGSYTYTLTTPAPVFSFLAGSIDAYNSVTLNLVDTVTSTMSSIVYGYAGTETLAPTDFDGRITFDTGSSTLLISGAIFKSASNSFEIDDIASAAPEPATWAMMILGFGFAGMGLRSSRRSRGNLALA